MAKVGSRCRYAAMEALHRAGREACKKVRTPDEILKLTLSNLKGLNPITDGDNLKFLLIKRRGKGYLFWRQFSEYRFVVSAGYFGSPLVVVVEYYGNRY